MRKSAIVNEDGTFRVPLEFKELTLRSLKDLNRVSLLHPRCNPDVEIWIRNLFDCCFVKTSIRTQMGASFVINRKIPKTELVNYLTYLLICSGDSEVKSTIYPKFGVRIPLKNVETNISTEEVEKEEEYEEKKEMVAKADKMVAEKVEKKKK